MKKTLILFLLVITSCSLFANFNYELDLINLKPLHKEYLADRSRPTNSIDYLYITDEGVPTFLHQHESILPFTSGGWDPSYKVKNNYLRINLGETFSFARNTLTFDHWLSPLSFDFSFQIHYRNLITGDISEEFGFDSVFFYGYTASIANKVSFRVGSTHYCSHIGDAIYDWIPKNIPIGDIDHLLKKYRRSDTLVFGVSVEPYQWLRVYGELNYIPEKIHSGVQPWGFMPSWAEVQDGSPQIKSNHPKEYKGRIINAGLELNYTIFKEMGKTTFAYNIYLYEEGKIDYPNDPPSGNVKEDIDIDEWVYNPDKPWEVEHSFLISQELSKNVAMELKIHQGRFPINKFFNFRGTSVSIGFAINLQGKANLADTKDNYYGLRFQSEE